MNKDAIDEIMLKLHNSIVGEETELNLNMGQRIDLYDLLKIISAALERPQVDVEGLPTQEQLYDAFQVLSVQKTCKKLQILTEFMGSEKAEEWLHERNKELDEAFNLFERVLKIIHETTPDIMDESQIGSKRTDITDRIWFSNKYPDLFWKDPSQKPSNCTEYVRASIVTPDTIAVKREDVPSYDSLKEAISYFEKLETPENRLKKWGWYLRYLLDAAALLADKGE